MKKFIGFLLVLWGFSAIAVSNLNAQEAVELKRSGNHINVLIGGNPFTTYYFDPKVAKPFFMPLRSAQGTIITRGFPIGNVVPPQHQHDPDLEPHQRPMYFGHGNIDGIDFWGEAVFPKWSDDSVFGRTVFVKLEQMRGGADSGVLKALFNLAGPSGRIIGEETQSYVFRGDPNTRIIDCAFTITANHGAPLTFGDTKEGTFALRLAKALNAPPSHMMNSNGGVGEKGVWGKRADWVDYDGKVGNEEVGVAIFDSPKSFRHPTYWHARGYGLFAVNPFGIREFTGDPRQDGSWTIKQGKTLTFRYRVFIHHGDYTQAHVAEAYRRYANQQQTGGSRKPDLLSGHWNCTSSSKSFGNTSFTLSLEQSGENLSGSVISPQGGMEITSGSFRGKNLEVRLDTEQGTYVLKAKLNGGQLVGEWFREGSSERGTWQGTRGKDERK